MSNWYLSRRCKGGRLTIFLYQSHPFFEFWPNLIPNLELVMCKPINRNEWYKRSSRLEGVILGVLLLFLPWFDIVSKVQYGEKHKKMKTNIIGLEWITGWSPQVRSRGFITQRLQGNGGFRGIGYRYIYIDISYHRTSSTHHQVILLMPIPYVCIYIYIIYPIYTPFISHIYIYIPSVTEETQHPNHLTTKWPGRKQYGTTASVHGAPTP